jgi:two-component system nitrate/nitrite response regulator NarL
MNTAGDVGTARTPRDGTTVLVVDDQQLVASTLTYSLRDNGLDAHYLVVTDLEAVQTAALAYLPGIVLLDLDLGAGAGGEPLDGVDLIVPLRAQGWTVLVISGTTDLDRIAAAVAHGAANWVVKGANFPELFATLVDLTHGRGHLPPTERATLINRYQEVLATHRKNAERLEALSPREREVLSRLTEGATAANIAAETHTSIRTVQTHIHRILTKLEVSSQLAATAIAVRHRSPAPPIKPSVWRRMRGVRGGATSQAPSQAP